MTDYYSFFLASLFFTEQRKEDITCRKIKRCWLLALVTKTCFCCLHAALELTKFASCSITCCTCKNANKPVYCSAVVWMIGGCFGLHHFTVTLHHVLYSILCRLVFARRCYTRTLLTVSRVIDLIINDGSCVLLFLQLVRLLPELLVVSLIRQRFLAFISFDLIFI